MLKKSVMAMMVITALASSSIGTGFANENTVAPTDPTTGSKEVIQQDKEVKKHSLEVMKRLRQKAKELDVDIKGMTIKEAKEVIDAAIAERKAFKELEELQDQDVVQGDVGVFIVEGELQVQPEQPLEELFALETVAPEDTQLLVDEEAANIEKQEKQLEKQRLKAEKQQQKAEKQQQKLEKKQEKPNQQQLKQDKQDKKVKQTKQKKTKGSK